MVKEFNLGSVDNAVLFCGAMDSNLHLLGAEGKPDAESYSNRNNGDDKPPNCILVNIARHKAYDKRNKNCKASFRSWIWWY